MGHARTFLREAVELTNTATISLDILQTSTEELTESQDG